MPFSSTVAQNYEQVTYRSPSLSQQRASCRDVIALAAAATLIPQQSGALVLIDAAAGFTITLPTPTAATIGMTFEFLQTVTQTSGTQKITAGTGVFLLGEVLTYTTATASPAGFALDGATHIAYASNGTTSGGIIGTRLLFTALAANAWSVTGTVVGSGVVVTPASTT